MKKAFCLGACAVLLAGIASWVGAPRPVVRAAEALGMPQYGADGKLVRPTGYRKWAYLSSGYGMSYSQTASDHLMFTNVFVTPSSYDYYVEHGTWPDKTMFVLEIYGSASKGSINLHGNYQSGLMGLDVEVKDEKRFEDKWAYFGFDAAENSSAATKPSKNDCWNCHDKNAAVEHSFVQFYPELLKIAKEKGTIKATAHIE
jgi:Cytochrome P460